MVRPAIYLARAVLWALLALTAPAAFAAAPGPVVHLRVEARNLTGPNGVGAMSDAELRTLIAAANAVWAPCAIRFVVTATANVAAAQLGVAYEPKGQEDLSRLAGALHPRGFDGVNSIPFTVAGPWRFYDAGTGQFLTGLGWQFVRADGRLERIGAMIDAQRVHEANAGALVAHELAHALSLPHVAERDNVMGTGGTTRLSDAQCRVARDYARTTLHDFVLRAR